jgi:DnaK suppressor protein
VDLPAIEDRLRARREELAAELERLTRPPEPGPAVSFGKRIGDGTTEAVERIATTAQARTISEALADVDRALAKIDEDSYGICDSCGRMIPEERLEAKPEATRCVDCLSRSDRS